MARGETYEEFVEKFKPKKTTDDCYTPPAVYEAVADYVEKTYGIDRSHFVRPFWPGGDYEHYPYKPDDVVVDNPPFSIQKEIRQFYTEHGIKCFLFTDARMCLKSVSLGRNQETGQEYTVIFAGCNIIYENGANVRTAFITNLESEYYARTAPELGQAIAEANITTTRTLPKYKYPPHVIYSTALDRFAQRRIDFRIPKNEAKPIGRLESQKAAKCDGIYGGGLLVSDRIAAERIAADRIAAERIAADRIAAERIAEAEKIEWTLSPSEMEIIEELSK